MNAVAPQVKGIRRIIRLEEDSAGGYSPVVLYDYRAIGEKKKTSRRLRPLEKWLRRMADARSTSAIEYQTRHRRSSEKKKNGWLKDLGKNVAKAERLGRKRIKLRKIFTA